MGVVLRVRSEVQDCPRPQPLQVCGSDNVLVDGTRGHAQHVSAETAASVNDGAHAGSSRVAALPRCCVAGAVQDSGVGGRWYHLHVISIQLELLT
jgi:hypothetical protein